MWSAKFKVKHDCIILSKMKNKNIKVLAHVMSTYEDNNHFFYTTFLAPVGDEKDKQQFISELKKDHQIIEIEEYNGQIITLTKEEKGKTHIAKNFSHELFLIEPILHEDNHEYWHLSSWKREKLIEFFNKTKEIASIEIIRLQEEKMVNIFYPKVMPKLAPQQKRAYEIALENGYYKCPQEIHLEQLAQKMNISRMAYRQHLRKAESKLAPFYAKTMEVRG